jgi:hypothetical protein
MITKEMIELGAACDAFDAAKAKLGAAEFAHREAVRAVDSAASRKARALDAMVKSCRTARVVDGARAELPTLPGDEPT